MKQELIGVVGKDHVLDDPKTLEGYAGDESFVLPIKPWYVARPGTEDEVKELVAWANKTGTPLVPVSSGAPHFYGDTVPSAPGAVMVDLSRLNKIRRIDRRNRMVWIEPGVTYAQLQPELAKEGMRVTPPLLPRANKSVIASLLERQPTLIPRYNYSLPEPLRNCGVVWGSGEFSYTGEAGAGSYDLEEQWAAGFRQLDPKGPAQTDFFRLLTGAQGSYGIVTWASVKCELLPTAQKFLFVTADRLEGLVDLTYRLTRLRLGDELLLVNNSQLAAMVGSDAAEISALKQELPLWVLIMGVGGRALLAEERVDAAEKDIAEVVSGFGLRLLSGLPALATSRVREAVGGLSGEPHWKLRSKGACQDIFFLTTLDKASGYLETMLSAAAAHKYPGSDVSVYLQPQHLGVSYHCEFSLPYDPSDAREVVKMKELHTNASEQLISQGAYFSRPYGAWAQPVYNRDAQSSNALRTVKNIFDPKNVLNPGKLCF
jgi:FAD/FMN-containing dehydrogenase